MHSLSNSFSQNGFEIFSFLDPQAFALLKNYALKNLKDLFEKYAGRSVSEEEIQSYHTWGKAAQVPHGEMLRAKNRHLQVPPEIKSLLINRSLTEFLARQGIHNFRLWDEGLGWLAFRLIRPGPGDGYPFSCKNWGPAKQVFSMWIPILGFSEELMIHLVPGSHLKEYPKYLPKDTHFTKDEFRLDRPIAPGESMRPKMHPGEALLFHPKTLHAEEIEKGDETRFNLEFRIEPL
jgi:hypothetical protein